MASVTNAGGRPLARVGARTTPSQRAALKRAIENVSYEVLPLRSTEEKVLTHLPHGVELTVTTTEAKGLRPTLDLAARMSGRGYPVAPHLAARLVRDEAHLIDIVAQLREAGVDSVFVIAGDAAEPIGEFPDALSLLERLESLGRPFPTVGIAGYPEGHGRISDQLIERALQRKTRHATHIVTQMCFDAGTTIEWARTVRAQQVDLPIRVGIPGAISRQKLVRVSAGLGLGQSARFLSKQQNMFWRFFLPGGYSPNRLVERLTPAFGQPDNTLRGLHIFTFNELERTEAWRRAWLTQLSGASGTNT